MKKLLLTSAVCVGLLSISQAYADFEAVENILTQVEGIEKKAQVVQQTVQKIESGYNALRQGDFGALVAVSSDLGFDKVNVNMPKVIADNVQNKGNLEQAIVKGTFPNYTKKDQVATHQAAKELGENMMREDLARMYAYAFTLRTDMAKKRDSEKNKKDELEPSTKVRGSGQSPDGEDSGTTDRLKKESMESARRINRIIDMQSAQEEFSLRLQSRTLSAPADEEKEGDAK